MKQTIIIRDIHTKSRAMTIMQDIPLASLPVVITLEPYRKKRSLAQNNLLWMWLNVIREHIRDTQGKVFSDEDIHEWFKDVLLPTTIVEINGKAIKARKSTAALNTVQFRDYLEQMEWYCAENLELVLPRPEDIYYEALKHDSL